MSQTIEDLAAAAAQLRRTGPVEAAIAAYERLLAAAPDLPNSWYNYALVLRGGGRPQDALAAYGEALRRGIDSPEQVHLNRAVIFADSLRQPDQAENELLAALQLNADYIPALLNLGNLEEDRGHRDAARKAYGRILARQPWFFEALARYAQLHTPRGPTDPMIDRLRRALAMPTPDALERASLGFALGRLLDAVGAYDEAFAAFAAANRDGAAAEALAGFPTDYDRAAQEALIDRIIAAYSRERVMALRQPEPEPWQGPMPIFICGMLRSGSTLCEQVLASHPDVTMGGELALLPRIAAQLDPMRISEGAVRAAARSEYLKGLRALFAQAPRVTDKRNDNFLQIGLILALFPGARIVHTQRAPFDTCLSIYFTNLDGRLPYARRLEDIGHYYRQYRRLMAHWQNMFGEAIFTFDYECFIGAQRRETEALLGYCGLAWHEACMDFHTAPSAVRTASVWQVREKLHDRACGRWRHYAAHLSPLRTALGDVAGTEGLNNR